MLFRSPNGPDASSAITIVQAADAEAVTEVDRSNRVTEDAPLGDLRADFAPKQTSDGTELTLPIAATNRYLGAVAAVVLVALVLGAGGVVLFGKRREASSTAAPQLASVGAAASQVPSAVALPPAAISSEPEVAAVSSVKRVVGRPALVGSGVVGGVKVGATTTTTATATTATIAATPTIPPTAVAVDPAYNPAGAYVVLGMLQRERVREDVVQGKMSAALPKLSACYRSALRMAGAAVPGSAEIHMSIDDRGNVTTFVNAPKHPQFARCAQEELAGMKIPMTALEPGSSGATVTQWLTLHP